MRAEPARRGAEQHGMDLMQQRREQAQGATSATEPGAAVGSVFADALGETVGPEMIALPVLEGFVGAFPSDPDASFAEQPRRWVRLARPIALGRFAVTFDEYEAFLSETNPTAATPDDHGFGRGRRPVINVSWRDATAYCAWLSARADAHYRLPSEAEWELACRADGVTPFHTGATITTDQANFDPGAIAVGAGEIRRDQTVEVGAFPPNAWGLHEMHGNIGEWCADAWSPDLADLREDGAPRPVDLEHPAATAVVRGGGWSTKRVFIRTSDRYHYAIDAAYEMVGFRVAREL